MLETHRIAVAYGMPPHLVERMTPYERGMARVCLRTWDEHTLSRATRAGGAMAVWTVNGG